MADDLGPLVRQYRRRKGWSQGQLALYTGLSQSYISQLEGGRYKTAEPPTLQKLADALSAPLRELLNAAGITDAPDRPIPPGLASAARRAAGVPSEWLEEWARLEPLLAPEDQAALLRQGRALVQATQEEALRKGRQRPDRGPRAPQAEHEPRPLPPGPPMGDANAAPDDQPDDSGAEVARMA
jgi:transcriptional regulator with XRE-family HTH domain